LDLQGNKTRLKIDKTSPEFPESNLMHQMNGYVYCNGPTLQLRRGQTVRWLVMGFGSEVDMHTPVFDGQAVQYAGAQQQQAVITPMSNPAHAAFDRPALRAMFPISHGTADACCALWTSMRCSCTTLLQ
jgi:hypothetical protein